MTLTLRVIRVAFLARLTALLREEVDPCSGFGVAFARGSPKSPRGCAITMPQPEARMKISRLVGTVIVALGFLLAAPVAAQQPGKVYRIGMLLHDNNPSDPARISFQEGLRALGWVEGQNYVIELRFAEGQADRFPAFAAELVRLKVDVIVTAGPPPTRAAQDATTTIPIVMATHGNPVGRGAVASLARPGGNITGLSSMSADLETKRLELLKTTVPQAVRVAYLWTAPVTNVDPWLVRTGVGAAARTLGVQLQHAGARDPSDLEVAFSTMTRDRADAVIVSNDPFQYAHRARIAELAIKYRLPAMYESRDYPDVGGLISYGVHFPDLFRRAASYVDKVLKGAKPADLPVEQPTKFELVVNLRTAKALGLSIPPAVLRQADEVIR
jgi:putative ABC transport system substrate-binding protein